MRADFIVVGQGLAGTLLSDHLRKEGKKVIVVDEGRSTTSSQVAAGIYNPVVFKRLTESWRADEFIPYAEHYYEALQHELGVPLLHKRAVVKLFVTAEEKAFWIQKKNAQQGIQFLGSVNDHELDPQHIKSPQGFATVNHSGNVEVKKMLQAYRTLLKKSDALIEKKFDLPALSIAGNNVQWNGIEASAVIFCEGHAVEANPYFSACRFKPAKGELLTVRIPDYRAAYTVNKGLFILPLGDGLFKVGATYEWAELDEQTTEKARQELIHKLSLVVRSSFEVVDQEAGIRPCTADRRPVMGRHPEHSGLAIFNGLGTKGVLLGPLLAREFAQFLIYGKILDEQVDLKRFF
jgi:glycine oxidase